MAPVRLQTPHLEMVPAELLLPLPPFTPPILDPLHSHEGIVSCPVPGTRCPTCAKEGKEVWVIPGRNCGYCNTPC
ncbi:hypothetical protein VHEMI09174 [[Torrubiella] hemipterigena]|uniref:Uncharacterized protein n=1 Tax=[Torrubiella] hemipterigena TaxID=1531966 RepID=A0A0A1T907_9HYPO|nr:hypothetical protein VHEMI09174 [[Torrubiella] hemipterigena]